MRECFLVVVRCLGLLDWELGGILSFLVEFWERNFMYYFLVAIFVLLLLICFLLLLSLLFFMILLLFISTSQSPYPSPNIRSFTKSLIATNFFLISSSSSSNFLRIHGIRDTLQSSFLKLYMILWEVPLFWETVDPVILSYCPALDFVNDSDNPLLLTDMRGCWNIDSEGWIGIFLYL